MKALALAAAALLACGADEPAEASPSAALQKRQVKTIKPRFETPNETGAADMDDPGVWVHPRKKARSLVIAAACACTTCRRRRCSASRPRSTPPASRSTASTTWTMWSTVSLPGFGGGLLITQDGYNDDLNGLDGKVNATNLKFTSWRLVAENFPGGPLKVDPEGYDPRQQSAR